MNNENMVHLSVLINMCCNKLHIKIDPIPSPPPSPCRYRQEMQRYCTVVVSRMIAAAFSTVITHHNK